MALRQSNVRAKLADRAGLAEQAGKDAQQAVDRAIAEGLIERADLDRQRLVAVLAGKPSARAVAVQVVANSPRVEGSQRTAVERSGSEWIATVDLDLNVSGGVLDALRFELPPQWNVVPEITPAMPAKIIDSFGKANRQLVVRPTESIAGPQHLRLRAPIAMTAGQRLRVPDVRPIGLGAVRRFVLLPRNSNEQQFAWETRGLNFEKLPASFASASSHTEIESICQVVGDTFEATLKSVEKVVQRPRVRLADIRLAMHDDSLGLRHRQF